MPKPPVAPRAYKITDNPLPFSKMTWYRWEKLGLFKLLRVGGHTLISADTVDAILSGEIKLPGEPRHTKPPMSKARRAKLSAVAAE